MKKKILILDDDNDILDIVSSVLSQKYEVITHDFIKDPVKLVESEDPHMILIDLAIPQIGGERAVKTLKSYPTTSHIPIYIFSANVDIESITRDIKADGYLSKPFDLKELRAFVSERLE